MIKQTTHQRPGITLAETLLSVTVMSIVLGGTTGAMHMIMLQGNKKQMEEQTRAESAVALHQLRSEIAFATVFSVMTEHAVEFTTPDVDGDGRDDTLRYEWSGNVGDPLIRYVNGDADYQPISDVVDLSIGYGLRVTETVSAGDSTESTPLALHRSASGDATFAQTVNLINPAAQLIVPSLPNDAISWSITSVEFIGRRRNLSVGKVLLSASKVSGGVPTATEMEVATAITDEDFPTTDPTPIKRALSRLTHIDPDAQIALRFRQLVPLATFDVQCVTSPDDGESMMATSSTGGLTWSPDPGASLIMRVNGTYEQMVNNGSMSKGTVESVSFTLTVNSDATERTFRTGGRTLNHATFSGVDVNDVPTNGTP